jgi:hypothetical protein
MATLESETLPPLPPAVHQRLAALRARIRCYIWLEGLAATAVWLGAAFWGSMAIDWCFEPPRPLRGAILAAAGIGLALVLFRFILRRAFVRLSDANMATVLERQFPLLNDSLLTSVSLRDRPIKTTGFNPQMLALTGNLARQRLRDLPISRVFNPMPLVRKVVIALGLALAIGLLAVAAPGVLDLWAQRNLLLAKVEWPRKIRLEAVGFTDGVAKVPQGGNFDLRVRAFRGDIEEPVAPPDKVEVRYRDEGGGRDRKTMKNVGQPVTSSAADEVLQEYSHLFPGVLSSKHLDIAGGDARLYDLQLKVVPNPNLTLKLVCEYPAYIERGAYTKVPVSAAVPEKVPIGSTVTIRGTANKPLEMVQIDGPAAERGTALHREFRGGKLGPEQDQFTFTFVPFPIPAAKPTKTAAAADRKGAGQESAAETAVDAKAPHEYTLQFTVLDTDGFKAPNPILLTLVAVPDEPPEVRVRLVGTREPVVTTQGRLPASGTLTDDHGLARAWWSYTVEERTPPAATKPSGDGAPSTPGPPKVPRQQSGNVALVKSPKASAEHAQLPKDAAGNAPLPQHPAEYTELPNHLPEFVVKEKEAYVEAAEMGLATGQHLTLAVRAADLCTFGNGPKGENIGSGETWQLDVVSLDELLTRLEAQELLVKQRFEAIVEEVTDTRNLLLKMNFTPPEKAVTASPNARPAGAEPGERQEEAPKFTADQLKTRRLERTLQALQNCRKNAMETADVVAAIEEIRLQLDNNQVDDEPHKKRIEKQVLEPLHYIVGKMFPEMEKRLLALQEKIGDLAVGPQRRDAAQEQADLILAKMREVLDHMMKTEDFNVNVVQRLKKIIKTEQELMIRTKKTEQDRLGE